eukprot:139466_1
MGQSLGVHKLKAFVSFVKRNVKTLQRNIQPQHDSHSQPLIPPDDRAIADEPNNQMSYDVISPVQGGDSSNNDCDSIYRLTDDEEQKENEMHMGAFRIQSILNASTTISDNEMICNTTGDGMFALDTGYLDDDELSEDLDSDGMGGGEIIRYEEPHACK